MTRGRTRYDAIVIGVGGVGSAALYHLARRGLQVLGLEQFEIAHDRGSSHGQTRVIRQAYFEHPDYVPLLIESYRLWRELESETGQPLFHQIGLVQVGPPDGHVISGVLTAAQRYQLDVETLDRHEIARRFPALSIPEGYEAVFERSAGYLCVEACVRAHVEAAIRRHAHLATDETVSSWSVDSGIVRVRTNRNLYQTERLVICAGPWSSQLLRLHHISLTVLAKHVYWFGTDHPALAAKRCPVFLYELPHGVFYGFPKIDARGVKLSEHSGGQPLEDASHAAREGDPEDFARVTGFARDLLPTMSPEPADHSVCLYTMSPDGHFLVDLERTAPAVAFVAGLSGHGFKFAPVLGCALTDLVLHNKTDLPIGFLSPGRFQDH